MFSPDCRQSTGELTDEEEISTYEPAAEVTTSVVVSTGDEDDQLKCRICKRFYTDARSLRCTHDFCFSCLCTFQTTTEDKACAVCGEMTVPPAEQIKLLVSNRDLNARVGKVMLRIGKCRFNNPVLGVYPTKYLLWNLLSNSSSQTSTCHR